MPEPAHGPSVDPNDLHNQVQTLAAMVAALPDVHGIERRSLDLQQRVQSLAGQITELTASIRAKDAAMVERVVAAATKKLGGELAAQMKGVLAGVASVLKEERAERTAQVERSVGAVTSDAAIARDLSRRIVEGAEKTLREGCFAFSRSRQPGSVHASIDACKASVKDLFTELDSRTAKLEAAAVPAPPADHSPGAILAAMTQQATKGLDDPIAALRSLEARTSGHLEELRAKHLGPVGARLDGYNSAIEALRAGEPMDPSHDAEIRNAVAVLRGAITECDPGAIADALEVEAAHGADTLSDYLKSGLGAARSAISVVCKKAEVRLLARSLTGAHLTDDRERDIAQLRFERAQKSLESLQEKHRAQYRRPQQ